MSDFIDKAQSIKRKLEELSDREKLKDFYFYTELDKLIAEWQLKTLPNKKADIGLAAIKYFDSIDPEDRKLAKDFCDLSEMYRIRARNEMLEARDRRRDWLRRLKFWK